METGSLAENRFQALGVDTLPSSTAPVAIRTALLTTDAVFGKLQREWDGLLEESGQGVFFLRWHWNHTWWKVYGPRRSTLFLITCRDEQQRLVGLAPLYLRRRYVGGLLIRELCFIGTGISLKTSEYLDLVARHGFERAVAEAVAEFLKSHGGWDRLWLWHIPADSQVLPHFCAALGPGVRVVPCDRAHYVDTTENWATTKGLFGRNLRQNIDRLIRRTTEAPGARFDQVDAPADLESSLANLVRLHHIRWRSKGQAGSFVSGRFEGFLREVAHQSLKDRRLRFWRLWINGECVSTLIAFEDFRVVHYFQSGFNPQSEFSIGRVVIGLAIRASVETDAIDKFDFMGGGASYKESWTRQVRETLELELLLPSARAFVYVSGRRMRALLSRIWRAVRRRLIRSDAR